MKRFGSVPMCASAFIASAAIALVIALVPCLAYAQVSIEYTASDVETSVQVEAYSGDTMIETAAAEAIAAYPQGCDTALIVGPGDAWVDAISAAGLSASCGPILFTESDSLSQATLEALDKLGVKSVIILGGRVAVGEGVESDLAQNGIAVTTRLGGADSYGTQMAIYEYGLQNNYWNGDMAIIATGMHYADALSISPVAYANKAPIFLTGSSLELNASQKEALREAAKTGMFTDMVVVGGTASVSDQTYAFATVVSAIAYGARGEVPDDGVFAVREAGDNEYETSAAIAQWAVDSLGFNWSGAAITTGKTPYDALAGAALTGKDKTVVLLVDDEDCVTISALAAAKDQVSRIRFFGGTASVSMDVRMAVAKSLGFPYTAIPGYVAPDDGSDGESGDDPDDNGSAASQINTTSRINSSVEDDDLSDESATLLGQSSVSTKSAAFASEEYAGNDLFETAAYEALAAYPEGSDSAIIVGQGDAWVDALSVSGLSAARGPILFSDYGYIPEATMSALRQLGVTSVIIVGGTAAVSTDAENQLASQFSVETRIAGENSYATQLAVYEYGVEHGLWGGGMAIVATGSWYADALSISPVAYAQAAPIFLTEDSGEFPAAQLIALAKAAISGQFKDGVIAGGSSSVSQFTQDVIEELAEITGGTTNRLWGANQFTTSIAIANWAVETQGFSWDNMAYTAGSSPYDALAGSCLQGKSRSVMLLVNSITDKTVSVASKHADDISTVRFFGGEASISPAVRNAIINSGAMGTCSYNSTGISLASFSQMEYAVLADGSVASYDDRLAAIDPSNYAYGTSDFYQFAVLNDGYTGQITAEQLNSFIDTYGSTGMLAGQGQAFIDAAQLYGVNEVYLLAHAILESGWGKSTLARGQVAGYEGYYNFFGFGAYDSDPGNGGGSAAKNSGWDTPYKAIVGAGETIAKTYLDNRYGQNTLYEMRWNYTQAAQTGSAYFQYATSISWPNSIGHLMAQCYSYLGVTPELRYEIPEYE